ncbi:hypothetical protein VKT23_004949 [Stygiomarasmius scandens]|uniref:DUF7918 domain-containing protein n=1 Tax=Marasmiellus scandens TaxID=2682957 RepID=A0ABR1JT84_9AGAR
MPLFLNQFTAWISIDGCVADEYGVKFSAKDYGASGSFGRKRVPQIECWIPSTEGKPFAIHWKDSKRITATDGIVWVDGKKCGGKVLSPDKPEADACKVGWRISATEVRPFVFAKVGLTDDDNLASPDAVHPHLGEIRLEVYEAAITMMNTQFNALEAIRVENGDTTTVHERTKKNIEHHTRLGTPLSSARPAVRVTRDPDSLPVARFLFRYRGLELLRAMGLAPSASFTHETEEQKPPVPAPGAGSVKEEEVKAEPRVLASNSIETTPAAGIRTPEPTPKLEDVSMHIFTDTKSSPRPTVTIRAGRSSLPSSLPSSSVSTFDHKPLTPPRSPTLSQPPSPSITPQKRKRPPERGTLEGAKRAAMRLNEALGLKTGSSASSGSEVKTEDATAPCNIEVADTLKEEQDVKMEDGKGTDELELKEALPPHVAKSKPQPEIIVLDSDDEYDYTPKPSASPTLSLSQFRNMGVGHPEYGNGNNDEDEIEEITEAKEIRTLRGKLNLVASRRVGRTRLRDDHVKPGGGDRKPHKIIDLTWDD